MVIISKYIFKFSMFISMVIIFLVIIFTYMFFERFLTEKTIDIAVINSAKFGNLNGKYLIFTPDEVFENSNNYYHEKTNADELFRELKPGKKYRVKVVGFYLPFISEFRNIIDIEEDDSPAGKLSWQ